MAARKRLSDTAAIVAIPLHPIARKVPGVRYYETTDIAKRPAGSNKSAPDRDSMNTYIDEMKDRK